MAHSFPQAKRQDLALKRRVQGVPLTISQSGSKTKSTFPLLFKGPKEVAGACAWLATNKLFLP